MALFLAFMWAFLSFLHAALAASLFHKNFNGLKALASWMAHFLANMSTFKRESTWFTTIWISKMAVYLLKMLFATSTSLLNIFKAWRTVSKVAFN